MHINTKPKWYVKLFSRNELPAADSEVSSVVVSCPETQHLEEF